MMKMIPLSKIKDNPYRDKKRNPVDQNKVEQLVESIDTTGFWKGVYGREASGGFVEIAFGHTRVDAARQLGLKEVPVEIEELTDADMLMRMTRENMRGELLVTLEAVGGAVKALGEGKVVFETVSKDTRKDVIRYAPSYLPGRPDPSGGSRPYTADTLARFLGGIYVRPPLKGRDSGGRAQDTVHAALGVLEMEERKIVGFSEKVLRARDVRDTDSGVQYLGAKKILEIVSDVKQREIKSEQRREKTKEELAAYDAEQRKIIAEQKERERKTEEERKRKVEAIAKAKAEDDAKKAKELREELKLREKEQEEKAVLDSIRIAEIDAKVKETKKRDAEAKKETEYAPVKRAVEGISRRLQIDNQQALLKEVQALVRKDLSMFDRDKLRSEAQTIGDWFATTLANMFLPPMSVKKQMAEYRTREEAKRRIAETEEKPKEKTKKNGKSK
jgi:hypothetical protein